LVIGGVKEAIRMKVSKNNNGEIIRVKPEFEDLKRLAEKTKEPLREISDLAIAKTQELL